MKTFRHTLALRVSANLHFHCPRRRDQGRRLINQPDAVQLAARLDPESPPPGHAVIRISPGGSEYCVYVIGETNEDGRVKSAHGPCKSK